MASLQTLAFSLLLFSAVIGTHFSVPTRAAGNVGVCYGLLGDNLPAATDVIGLYKRYNIGKLRLFNPNPAALEALRGSGIAVTVGIPNEDLPALAGGQGGVSQWVGQHIEPYAADVAFEYIAVGNEVIPGELGQYVLPVMQSLHSVLALKNLAGVKVTTVVPGNALSASYPPSSGAFSDAAAKDLRGVLGLLSLTGSPLMINVYPYFAYAADPINVRLDYAQFTAQGAVVEDRGLSYYNLFDAMVDAFIWAMESLGGAGVNVVVAESGWPSAGNGDFTSPALAGTYVNNFKNHINTNTGTPKRPGTGIEGFIFAMFNEDQKPGGVEQNFGLFYPNMSPVYPVF